VFKSARIITFYTMTPLHMGSGTSTSGADLPIQRERHTEFPIGQASGIKGSLRHVAEATLADKKVIELIFGPDTQGASEHAGALSLTDARLLLFPVRSAKGLFGWITCPAQLSRLKRDVLALLATSKLEPPPAVAAIDGLLLSNLLSRNDVALLPKDTHLLLKSGRVVLEDLCFELPEQGDTERQLLTELAAWVATSLLPEGLDYWAEKLKYDVVLLNDEVFSSLVKIATEIVTRIKLDNNTGVVAEGPWDEEQLPTESLLYSVVLSTSPRASNNGSAPAEADTAGGVLRVLEEKVLTNGLLQLGGNETVGRGLVRVRFFPEGRSSNGTGN
jgi:CRISPR-associated protein Cmr4